MTMKEALQEAVEKRINFCWWPRIPSYGYLNQCVKEKTNVKEN